MRIFRARLIKGTEIMDLINTNDESDSIPAAPDEFKDGEIISEDDIEMKDNSYVDDETYGSMLFAFRKIV